MCDNGEVCVVPRLRFPIYGPGYGSRMHSLLFISKTRLLVNHSAKNKEPTNLQKHVIIKHSQKVNYVLYFVERQLSRNFKLLGKLSVLTQRKINFYV